MKNKHVETKSKKSGGNALLIVAIVILIGGILFSGWKLFSIFRAYKAAADEFSSMSEQFTSKRETGTDTTPAPSTPKPEARNEDEEPPEEPEIIFQSVDMECGFNVNFDAMWQTNPDVVGWLNSEGTVIDYPVMHGATNDTYLHANWKGSYSVSGSIFTNYRCRGDLSDLNTIIYGHNMKDGSMFHSIKSYNTQSYYENHPYMWYVTPEANYVLYVVGAFVAETTSPVYSTYDSVDEVRDLLRYAKTHSDFTPDYVISGLDADTIVENAKRMVVLSTCSYEFNNARFVVIAVPLLAQ